MHLMAEVAEIFVSPGIEAWEGAYAPGTKVDVDAKFQQSNYERHGMPLAWLALSPCLDLPTLSPSECDSL